MKASKESIDETKTQTSNRAVEEKKLLEVKEKNKFTFNGLYDKIKETFLNIKKNIDLITDDATKRAIKLCKDELLHIIKVLFPKKIRGEMKFGMENPALTGEFYGVYCALFLIHKGDIVLIPYFNEKIFEYRVMAKGYVQVITLLIIAIKIYFNKDIQRLIKIFQKEEE